MKILETLFSPSITCHYATLTPLTHFPFLGISPNLLLLFLGLSFLRYFLDFMFAICLLNGDVSYGFCPVSSHLKSHILLGKTCSLQDFALIYASMIPKSLPSAQALPLSTWVQLNVHVLQSPQTYPMFTYFNHLLRIWLRFCIHSQ